LFYITGAVSAAAYLLDCVDFCRPLSELSRSCCVVKSIAAIPLIVVSFRGDGPNRSPSTVRRSEHDGSTTLLVTLAVFCAVFCCPMSIKHHKSSVPSCENRLVQERRAVRHLARLSMSNSRRQKYSKTVVESEALSDTKCSSSGLSHVCLASGASLHQVCCLLAFYLTLGHFYHLLLM